MLATGSSLRGIEQARSEPQVALWRELARQSSTVRCRSTTRQDNLCQNLLASQRHIGRGHWKNRGITENLTDQPPAAGFQNEGSLPPVCPV